MQSGSSDEYLDYVSEHSLRYTGPVIESTPRARPMPRDDRRAAIIAATIPLVVEHGTAVTTRQIAHAAGVAEGTLFRAFADKDEILRATVCFILDPEPIAAELRAVPTALSLVDLVTQLVLILAARQELVMRVMGVAHQILRSPATTDEVAATADSDGPGPQTHDAAGSQHDARSKSMQILLAVVAERLDAYRPELRLAPEQAARVLLSIVMGNSLPIVGHEGRLDASEIVDVVLHGVGSPGLAKLTVIHSQPSERSC